MAEEIREGIYLEFSELNRDKKFQLYKKNKGTMGCLVFSEHYLSGEIYIHVNSLDIYPNFRGEKLSIELLSQINDYIKKNKVKGLLQDYILTNNPANGMYERHGWSNIPNISLWKSFNVQKNKSSKLEKIIAELKKCYSHF